MAYLMQRRRGLGANTNCGPSPCGFSDYFWVGADCGAWNACQAQAIAAPAAPLDLNAQIAALPIGTSVSALLAPAPVFETPAPVMGTPNWGVLAAVAAGLIVFAMVKR
jgi:hypothetical protein